MLTDPTPDPGLHTGIRIYVAVSAAVLVAALCYVGWVFWSRAHENQLIEERVAAQRRAQDEQTVESMGGDRFEILAFYANPPTISRGDSADLCYSVSNAKSVSSSRNRARSGRRTSTASACRPVRQPPTC